MTTIGSPPEPLSLRNQDIHWLPTVQTGDQNAGIEKADDFLDPMAAELVTLLREHEGQNRSMLWVDPCLVAVAREKVYLMARQQEMAHVVSGYGGPNRMAREIGCYLPAWYPNDLASNNIESIGEGYSTPQEMLDGWLGSPGHKRHVLGLGTFFAGQIQVGAAVFWDDKKHPWWCFLSAPVPEAG